MFIYSLTTPWDYIFTAFLNLLCKLFLLCSRCLFYSWLQWRNSWRKEIRFIYRYVYKYGNTDMHPHTHILFVVNFSCVSVISLCRIKISGDFTLSLFSSLQYLAQGLEHGRYLIQRNCSEVVMTHTTTGKTRGHLSVCSVPSLPQQSPYFGLLSSLPAAYLPICLFMLLLDLLSRNQIYNTYRPWGKSVTSKLGI